MFRGNKSCRLVLLQLIFAKGFKKLPFLENIVSLRNQIQIRGQDHRNILDGEICSNS